MTPYQSYLNRRRKARRKDRMAILINRPIEGELRRKTTNQLRSELAVIFHNWKIVLDSGTIVNHHNKSLDGVAMTLLELEALARLMLSIIEERKS